MSSIKHWNVRAALCRPKDKKGNLNKLNGVVNGGLLYIVGMDEDFIVCSHHMDLGEEGTTEKLLGVVMDMMDEAAVEDGPGADNSVVAAGTPNVGHNF
jgi:hypothetical protein